MGRFDSKVHHHLSNRDGTGRGNREPGTSETSLALGDGAQCFVSFAAVLACYWVYWFVAVPLIEPIAEERVAQTVTEEQVGEARIDVSQRQRRDAQYFNPEDWEAKSPAIWQNDQMRLLFGKLTTNPDGSVMLEPCTLMFFPKGPTTASGRPIIMRTERGAIVRFDERIVVRASTCRSASSWAENCSEKSASSNARVRRAKATIWRSQRAA